MRLRTFLAAVVLAAVVVLPQQAVAAGDFYAQSGATGSAPCPQTSPCPLDVAVTAAGSASGGTVHVIGPLTWTAPLSLSGAPIVLRGSGSGPGGTFIDTSGSYGLTLQDGSSADHVHVRSAQTGVLLHYGSAITDSLIETTATGSYAVNGQFSSSPGAAVVARDTLNAPANGVAAEVGNGGPTHTLLIQDSTLNAGAGVDNGTSPAFVVQRSTINASHIGLNAFGSGPAYASDTVIHMTGAASTGALASGSFRGVAMTLIEDTIDGADTTGASTGVDAAPDSGPLPTNSVTVTDSIVRGFATDLRAAAGSNAGGSVTATRSDYATAIAESAPAGDQPGVFTNGGGNVNRDPAFVSRAAGDYRLRTDSPLIDAAGAAPIDTANNESPTDRASHPRIVDGNKDGIAARDMGAFEYQPPRVIPCVVPKLKGKKLGKARRLLTAAHCSLGKVKKPKHHRGKIIVKSQSPSPGTVLSPGAKVSVKLGAKPHHKKRH